MTGSPLLWSLLGCRHEEVTFPARLSPLEENRAAWPDPAAESLSVVSGGDSDLWWAHSRGYVHAPLARVWAALADPDVLVDRREVDEWEVTDEPLPAFDRSWLVHLVVQDVITVDYDLTWAWEIQLGGTEAPERVVARWDKTAGTPFIDILRGTIELEPHPDDPDVTSISVVDHLQAALRDDETLVQYLEDLHRSVVAATHGDPLPTW
jgi:uncharacterized protein YndB with AHSA1/START domain